MSGEVTAPEGTPDDLLEVRRPRAASQPAGARSMSGWRDHDIEFGEIPTGLTGSCADSAQTVCQDVSDRRRTYAINNHDGRRHAACTGPRQCGGGVDLGGGAGRVGSVAASGPGPGGV